MERICPCGGGRPDPDDLTWQVTQGRDYLGVHGCDGCCARRRMLRLARRAVRAQRASLLHASPRSRLAPTHKDLPDRPVPQVDLSGN